MTENAAPGVLKTIPDFFKSLTILFDWKRLKNLSNQSIKDKVTVAVVSATSLTLLSGALAIITILSITQALHIGIWVIAATMLASITIAVMSSSFITKSIMLPIHTLIESSDRIAAGDFTIELSKDYDDEIGELVDHYNGLLESLREMMGMLSGEQATAYMAAEENAEAKAYVDRKVQEILAAMDSVAQGDLTVQLDIENEDEIGQLYAGFNRVVTRLSEIIEKVHESADMVNSSGKLIKEATIQLGKGTESQVSNTDQILEKVEFLSGAAQSISITSEQTCTIVQDGIDITASAEKNVGKTVTIMIEIAENAKQSATLISGLNESSEKIGEIVSLIKDIASQTNLLALNAAIEAARAGTHGKGFAVVADEVKKLAERTTVSTTEISDRIATIQEQTAEVTQSIEEGLRHIENGTEIASMAQQSLEKVMESTEMGVQMVMQIDASSGMQTEHTADIASSIKEIVSSINESEEQVREITSVSQDMNNLTQALKEAVDQFVLKNYASGNTAPAAPATPTPAPEMPELEMANQQ